MSMDLFSTVLGVDYQDDHPHDELRADLVDLVNRPEMTHESCKISPIQLHMVNIKSPIIQFKA